MEDQGERRTVQSVETDRPRHAAVSSKAWEQSLPERPCRVAAALQPPGSTLSMCLGHGMALGAGTSCPPDLEARGRRMTAVELPGRRGDATVLGRLKPEQFVASVL